MSLPTLIEPSRAGRLLAQAIKDPRVPHTLADAVAESGLAIRDAERGLAWLTQEYRGHLRATEQGELLYVFPHAFTQPWKTRDALSRALSRGIKVVVGAGRFIVRAWLMIVLLGYVALFLVVLLTMAFARQRDDESLGGDAGDLGFVLFRVLGDALFWTFHPFSPFSEQGGSAYGDREREPFTRQSTRLGRKDDTPFYEKVNRFFFGPSPVKRDGRERARAILAEMRAQKGRIGLADVMRVTGLSRDVADPLMARLMLDYDGAVTVSPAGGITYQFASLRKTVAGQSSGPTVRSEQPPRAAWDAMPQLPPLTGNSFDTNMLIAGLNLFNLVMSGVAIEQNLTLAKLPLLFTRIPLRLLPYDGTPLALGLVPLIFSLVILLIPIGRVILRPLVAARVARERGRLGVLREVLSRVEKREEVTDERLEAAWTEAAGRAAPAGEISAELANLGAGVDTTASGGDLRYRFIDLESEAVALEEERQSAEEAEVSVGRVVFASDE